MIKRTFDIGVSVIGLIALAPLLSGIALVIRMTSAGPIFYRGVRVGRNERIFRIFKFRSMVMNAECIGGFSTSDRDPRITPIGKFMRKCKLDELPQLLNVLRGEMSLVGPRPQVPEYTKNYTEDEKEIFHVRPGITDWASIWNSDEGAVLALHEDPDQAYDDLIHPIKVQLQLKYVHEQSLYSDIKILISTILCIFFRTWLPAELRQYPQPGTLLNTTNNYETVTETPGTPINYEQLSMLHTRYHWAAQYSKGLDVLEVACGSGIGLGYLANKSKHIVGGDCDEKLVRICRETYGSRIDIKRFDAQALPFDDATFDILILFEAIYYLPKPELFLREAHRVLRANGKVLICAANCERSHFNPSPYSTSYFTARQLVKILDTSGFHTEVFAGFPVTTGGLLNSSLNSLRAVAVKLQLIPKTMKWKARIKRLFFKDLQVMPSELGADLGHVAPVDRINHEEPNKEYKVLYAIGKRIGDSKKSAA